MVVDQRLDSGGRWIEVGPPDGSANLALAHATPGTDAEKLVGRDTNIYFLTEDVTAKYNEWTAAEFASSFHRRHPAWGGIFTRFEDVDGNSFGLAGFDELTSGVEARRRELAQKLESERRAAQELEIAKQVQSRLFPQIHPEAQDPRIRRPLPSRPPRGRRLLRLPRSRPAPARPRHRRRLRQRHRRRPAHGQPASQLAQPVCSRSGSSRTPASIREPPVLTRTQPTAHTPPSSSPSTTIVPSACAMPTADIFLA